MSFSTLNEATVPANTTSTLYLLVASVEDILESGKPEKKAKGVTFVKVENGRAIYELGSWSYVFVMGK